MATHSSILAWRISWTEQPGGLQSMGHKELDTAEQQCYMEKQKDMCSALVDKQGRFKRTEISAGLLTCGSQSTLEEKQNINKGTETKMYNVGLGYNS